MRLALAIAALTVLGAAQRCQVSVPVSLLQAAQPGSVITAGALRVLRPRGANIASLVAQPPRHVEILIEASGHMAGDIWRESAALSDALLLAIPPPAQVRLAAFEDKIAPMVPFHAPASDYRPALASAYARFRPYGGTAFYDAIALSIAPATAFRPGDAIVAVADGADDSSRVTAAVALQALQTSQIRLVLLPPRRTAHRAGVAEGSGGAVVASAQEAWRILAAQYWLTLQLSGSDAHPLQLKLPPGFTAFAADTHLSCPARP